MIYRFDSRLMVQISSKVKHFCKVVSASTDHSYPFSIPAATIEVIANSGTTDFISNIKFDNVVRLQVSVRYSPVETPVWYDIFEGRIIAIQAQYGTANTANLLCVGHENEAGYTLLDEAKVWSTATDLKDILLHYDGFGVRERIKLFGDTNTGLSCQYATKQGQKYMKDLFSDCEQIAGFKWFFGHEVYYDANGFLSGVQVRFQPFATKVTNNYKAIQGTPRFLSANFETDGKDVHTRVIEYGQTPSTGSQFIGTASDTTNIAKYGTRTLVNTDTGLTSSALCASFATSVLPYVKDPRTSGSIELLGTPNARVGDLMHCDIAMIDLNGDPVYGDYSVMKVHHSIAYNSYTTTVDVGKAQSDITDYVAEFARKNRLNMQNFIN